MLKLRALSGVTDVSLPTARPVELPPDWCRRAFGILVRAWWWFLEETVVVLTSSSAEESPNQNFPRYHGNESPRPQMSLPVYSPPSSPLRLEVCEIAESADVVWNRESRDEVPSMAEISKSAVVG